MANNDETQQPDAAFYDRLREEQSERNEQQKPRDLDEAFEKVPSREPFDRLRQDSDRRSRS
jgi:hypothetical protein